MTTRLSLRPGRMPSLDRRGSSKSTEGSGSGLYSASCVTLAGSEMSIACSPPECHVLNAMLGVSVGLCAEYEVRGGLKVAHESGSFSARRYSPITAGLVSSSMSMNRVQPHGQPWPEPVAVP